MLMENNDGSVELASQLYYRAQDDARVVRGLNEDHTGILTSPEAIKVLNRALDQVFQEK